MEKQTNLSIIRNRIHRSDYGTVYVAVDFVDISDKTNINARSMIQETVNAIPAPHKPYKSYPTIIRHTNIISQASSISKNIFESLFANGIYSIGETIACLDNPKALPLIKIDEPTLQMNFSVNNSPFAGQEGKFVTSRQLRKRLYQELEKRRI